MTTTDDHPDTGRNTLDQLFASLNNSARRHILTALAEGPPHDENDVFEPSDFKPANQELEQFRVQLYHQHLPYLEHREYISWDRDADFIKRGPNFAEIQALLDVLNGHQDELPGEWP